jgi:hypothetical protein
LEVEKLLNTLGVFIKRKETTYSPCYDTILIKKYIWDCKMRRALPSFELLKFFVYREMRTMTGVSVMARSIIENCELSFLFRLSKKYSLKNTLNFARS